MKSIRLPIDTTPLDHIRIKQSSIIKSAYNMACKGYSLRQAELTLVKRYPYLDGHIFRSGVKNGFDIYNAQEIKGITFGGKTNFDKLAKGKITKNDWKRLRLLPLYSIGQANAKGNRRFRLTEKELIYKDESNGEICFLLPKLKSNWQRILNEITKKSNNKEIPLTYKVSDDFIDIIYDEKLLDCYKKKYKEYIPIYDRVIGIDMNPLDIGISVFDGKTNKVIHYISLKYDEELSNNKSNHIKSKVKNELSHILDHISDLCIHYQVNKIVIEDLNIKNKDHKKGKRFNRLVNNNWHRTFIVAKLQSICNLFQIKLTKINPAYTSFIGNLMYPDLPDSCAAACEIARRGHRKYVTGFFYPRLIKHSELEHRWKEMANLDYKSWVELYNHFKNLQLGWRTQGYIGNEFRFISANTKVIARVSK